MPRLMGAGRGGDGNLKHDRGLPVWLIKYRCILCASSDLRMHMVHPLYLLSVLSIYTAARQSRESHLEPSELDFLLALEAPNLLSRVAHHLAFSLSVFPESA